MSSTIITLPKPVTKGTVSLEECLLKRRSKRAYRVQDLTLEQISQLCWATQGITETVGGFRTAPSAGATYPLELYLVKSDGLFHYLPEGHKLEKVKAGDFRKSLCSAALGQRFVAEAPVDFVITAIYERTTARYRQRGIRYVDIEVGHAAQNLHLQAVALGLGSVPVGAFDDDAVSEILSLPKEEKPLYIIPVGYIRQQDKPLKSQNSLKSSKPSQCLQCFQWLNSN
ncbi:MAG: SagB/ThcOx family dehydrogenase [Candidatus Edwardsbacteria bacterium]